MAYEKMSCLYESVKDLMDRINGTICRYKDHPFYVMIDSKGQAHLYDTTYPLIGVGNPLFTISPKDPDFDISSVELGYVNWKYSAKQMRYIDENFKTSKNNVSWCYRSPHRRFRQGISSDNITTTNFDRKQGHNNEYVIYSEGFRNSLLGIYPSIPESIELISGGKESEIAVSKEFALSSTEAGLILVYAETRNIGWILPGNMNIEIADGELKWVYRRLMDKFLSI